MNFLLILAALNMTCFADYVHQASGVEIRKNKLIKARKTSKRNVKTLISAIKKDNKIDSRLLAVAYLENRLRLYAKRGDKGQACGIFQIHAKYSYPMFHRKRGFIDWNEKHPISRVKILKECNRLNNVNYSIKTMNKLINIMDNKGLHPCHHNSGFYGKCNTWYKQRINILVSYFEIAKLMCSTQTPTHKPPLHMD